eukprot:Skav213580  [mRNA]  locus=scaffold1790:243229:244806:- [translate_table: standard]
MLSFQSAFLDQDGVCPMKRVSSGAMFDLYLATRSECITLLLLLQLVAVLCFMVGFWTKTASFICWLFALSQYDRLIDCVAGHKDHLRSHLLFWALFLPLGQAWSVDAYRSQRGKREVFGCEASAPCLPWLQEERDATEEKDGKDKGLRSMAAPLSAFLVLLEMAGMYSYTVSTRTGPLWLNGDAVLQTLQLTQYARQPVAGIIAMFPSICRFFTHATLYAEKYVWLLAFLPFQLSRTTAFGIFFALHFGLQISLCLGSFQLISISAWCVVLPSFFLDYVEATVQATWRWCRSSQLLVIQPTAPKQGLGRAASMGMTVLGFSLMYTVLAEGCLHRQEDQWLHGECSMAPMVRDFGSTELLKKLGLLHRYFMFSPDPTPETLRVQLYGILSSPECLAGEGYWTHCQVVELWGRGFPSVPKQLPSQLPTWSNLSTPAPQRVDFATVGWRRLVQSTENSKAIGGYMCRQWQAQRQAPDLLGLWFVRISAIPGSKETFKGVYRHWCTEDAKRLMLELPRQPWACNTTKCK